MEFSSRFFFFNTISFLNFSFGLSFSFFLVIQLIALRTSACPIVIVGNIFDGTERIVNRDMVDEMIEKWKCGYIECNAKENTNIVEIFEEALIQLNIQYDLSEAVCRRRRSFPMYNGNAKGAGNGLAKLIKLMKLKWF